MISDECPYCRSVRVWKGFPVRHEGGCPTAGRARRRLSVEVAAVFAHPDVVELDLHVSAWYPALTS